jgi:acetolactate synthase small subunit
MQRHLRVYTQSKLGALDRVLGALTHRGIIPNTFLCEESTATGLKITAQFHCADDHMMHKLCKFLDRQVYILSVEDISPSPVCAPLGLTAPPFPEPVLQKEEALA